MRGLRIRRAEWARKLPWAERAKRSLVALRSINRLLKGSVNMWAADIFTPSSYPTHTYVNRTDIDVEQTLSDNLSIAGQVVSIAGPSKCGKTVLVEKAVGKDVLIPVTGSGIQTADDFWNRVLDWIGEPHSTFAIDTNSSSLNGNVGASAKGKIPAIAEFSTEFSAGGGKTKTQATQISTQRRGMQQVVQEIANSQFTVLLDDFHYMQRPVQEVIAQQIKEASRLGVRIVLCTVPHRTDDAVRALPDLRGRVTALDLGFWKNTDLIRIAELGYQKLNIGLNRESISRFAREAAGSPQLMQAICLQSCFYLGIRDAGNEERRAFTLTDSDIDTIFERTSAMTDYKSAVDFMAEGPKTRGRERVTHPFRTGGQGDVYGVLIRTLVCDPPQQLFTYRNLVKRAGAVSDDPPDGSSLAGACAQIARLLRNSQTGFSPVDWDGEKNILHITDPYLLFYLRWSGRVPRSKTDLDLVDLMEAERS
jgi:hypothetical protein